MAALAGAVVIVAALAWGVFTIGARERALRHLPDPDLSGFEEPVADKLREVQTHVRQHPRSAEGWGRLGMNYDVHGLPTEALTSYQQAAKLDPGSFHWVYFTAIVQQQQRSEDAITSYERARELRPGHVPVLIRMGQSLIDANRWPNARRAFEDAIALDSNFSSYVYLGLARVAVVETQWAEAQRLLLLGLERNSSHRDIYVLLAEVYRRQDSAGPARRASSMADQLPSIAPLEDSVYARVTREGVGSFWAATRGRTFLNVNEYAAAVRELTTALEIRPTAPVHADLGKSFHRMGRLDEAAEQYRHALSLDPDHLAALIDLGVLHVERNRRAEGYSLLARAKQVAPDSAQPYLRLATLHAAGDRWSDAAAELRAGLARLPEHYQLTSRLALLLASAPMKEIRDGPEAVRLARLASALRSHRDAEALAVLATAYAEIGNRDSTLATAREARRLATVARKPALAQQIEASLRRFEARFAAARN